jgi:hypothetical protein
LTAWDGSSLTSRRVGEGLATVTVFGHASSLYGFPHLLQGRPIEDILEHGIPWQDDWAGWNFTAP